MWFQAPFHLIRVPVRTRTRAQAAHARKVALSGSGGGRNGGGSSDSGGDSGLLARLEAQLAYGGASASAAYGLRKQIASIR